MTTTSTLTIGDLTVNIQYSAIESVSYATTPVLRPGWVRIGGAQLSIEQAQELATCLLALTRVSER